MIQFTTGDEREYPEGFCESYAACLAPELKGGERFAEVFSGPMSRAVCDYFGLEVPGCRVDARKGLKNELLSQVIGSFPILKSEGSCGKRA